MENNYSTLKSDERSLVINELAYGFLRGATQWAKFLSVVGFIGIAFLLLFALFLGLFVSMLPDAIIESSPIFQSASIYAVTYIIVAVIYIFPVYFLYKFSVNTREALDSGNQDFLAQGLRSLKSHYKFVGIITIVCIAIYIVVLVSVVVLGLATALTV